MKYRVPILIAVGVAVGALATVPLAGQASRAAAAVAKTAWGDPDLSGLWKVEVGVPLERPARFKGRGFLTDEEVAAKRKSAEEIQTRTAAGNVYEFAFRSQANLNAIFHYDEELAPISRRTAQIVDPPDGRLPPLTPQAVKAWEEREKMTHGRGEADHWTDRGLGERCITVFEPGRVNYWGLGNPAAPRPVKGVGSIEDPTVGGADVSSRDDTERASGEPDAPMQRIVQAQGVFGVVAMDAQGFRAAYHMVPLDGRPPFGPKVRQNHGDPRGHWEGNTLVIETTNLSDNEPLMATYGQNRYPGTRETLKIIERYTRIDMDHMEYRYTIDDPATYTRPYTVLQEMTRKDNFAVAPELCHENNKDTAAQLAAARADEANATDVAYEYAVVRQQRLEEVRAAAAAADKNR